jgi:hypothetical protein
MGHEIMECGCVSMTTHVQDHNGLGENHPSCFTHDCCIVKRNQPDLSGRKARCAYYGRPMRHNECNACSHRPDNICMCEKDSSVELAFFVYQPTKEFDEFYCGCHSWD